MKVVKPKRIELTLIVYGIAGDFNTKYTGSAIIGVFPFKIIMQRHLSGTHFPLLRRFRNWSVIC